MPRIITVGEILVEVMAKETGQDFLKPGEFIGPFPSGAPAIFIDQVARMNVDCGIISRIGNDDFGLLNIERLRKDGVDISRILVTPGYTTGTAFITYFPDGGRKFIFHFTHSAAGMLNPDDIDESYIQGAEYLHIMGCSLSASESMRRAILKAVKIAKGNQIKISFDPNIRFELLDATGIKNVFLDVLAATDILLTGKHEAMILTESTTPEGAAKVFQEKGIHVIVMKDGSQGVTTYSGTEFFYVPSIQVNEVDPTGAGDCFDGAFLASLADGRNLQEAVLIATVAGAFAVTRKGPMEGAAWKADVLKMIGC